MASITSTFSVTTALSIVLHGVAVVGWLSMSQPVLQTGQRQTNQSIELQLIGAEGGMVQVSSDAAQSANDLSATDLLDSDNKQLELETRVLDSKVAIAPDFVIPNQQQLNVEKKLSSDSHQETSTKVTQVAQGMPLTYELLNSASSSQNLPQNSMLELLHASISDNKKYPYIARRQRREGTAKVGFVLNPDGSIQNARLVTSSRASVLDRAALSAVRAIEPFKPAKHYLEQAEAFEIDVVFKLL